ncbi:MAG: hypothetical protein GYB26_10165 [Gammaproteobacteria bacterium]|nr:hypothetical protein [Gammaproteobacteria bacterium]
MNKADKKLDRPAGVYPHPREVEYIGSMTTIEPYLERHRPQNQQQVNGFPINPTLRPGFDATANEDRDPLEAHEWWGLPYIQTDSWDKREMGDRQHREWLKVKRPEYVTLDDAEFEKDLAKRKKHWFEDYPSGTRYTMRCLDGGAWDRSTWRGDFSSLEAAIEAAQYIHGQSSFLAC